MSKCDFNLRFTGALVSNPDPNLVKPSVRFDLGLPLTPLSRLTNSLTDWQLTAGPVEVSGRRERVHTLQARLPAGQVHVGSDKCDWSVRVTGRRPGGLSVPSIETGLAASKCDFSVRVNFGVERGPGLRFSAVASSKCDFRIDQVQSLDPKTGKWKTIDIGSGKPSK